MILASRVASRILFPFCLAGLAALAVVLPGCGDDTAANARDTPQTSAEATVARSAPPPAPGAEAVGQRCRNQVGGFLDAMVDLRERLVSGLSYEEYVGEIGAIRASYDQVPVKKLALACLSAAGTPGELAFDQYIEAANSWGECIEEDGCDAAEVEPVLQKQWRRGSLLLDEARSGLAG